MDTDSNVNLIEMPVIQRARVDTAASDRGIGPRHAALAWMRPRRTPMPHALILMAHEGITFV